MYVKPQRPSVASLYGPGGGERKLSSEVSHFGQHLNLFFRGAFHLTKRPDKGCLNVTPANGADNSVPVPNGSFNQHCIRVAQGQQGSRSTEDFLPGLHCTSRNALATVNPPPPPTGREGGGLDTGWLRPKGVPFSGWRYIKG